MAAPILVKILAARKSAFMRHANGGLPDIVYMSIRDYKDLCAWAESTWDYWRNPRTGLIDTIPGFARRPQKIFGMKIKVGEKQAGERVIAGYESESLDH